MSTKLLHSSSPTTFGLDAPRRRGGRTKRTYRCSHCARIFKRNEHCARHERVHTQEKPFPCGFCERKYARKDLVKRHERSLHVDEYRAAHPDEFYSETIEWQGSVFVPRPRNEKAAVLRTLGDEYSSIESSILRPFGVLDRLPSAAIERKSIQDLNEELMNQFQPYPDQEAPSIPMQEYLSPDLQWCNSALTDRNPRYHDELNSTESHDNPIPQEEQIEIDPLLLASAPPPWVPQSSHTNEHGHYVETQQSVDDHIPAFRLEQTPSEHPNYSKLEAVYSF